MDKKSFVPQDTATSKKEAEKSSCLARNAKQITAVALALGLTVVIAGACVVAASFVLFPARPEGNGSSHAENDGEHLNNDPMVSQKKS